MASGDELYDRAQARAAQADRRIGMPERPVPVLTAEEEGAYTAALSERPLAECKVGIALGFLDADPNRPNVGAYPGLSMLSRKTGIRSPGYIRNALSGLVKCGALVARKVGSGPGAYHHYFRVPVDRWPEFAEARRLELERRRAEQQMRLRTAERNVTPQDCDLAA